MKWQVYVMLLFILVFALSSVSLGKYSGGTGEPNDPFLIATPNDLNSIGLDPNDWDKHFLMTEDLNLVGANELPIIGYDGSAGTRAFTGVFDGNGHTISNFAYVYDENDGWYVGLFGYVSDPNAEIRNVGLIRPRISFIGWTGAHAGCVAGYLENGRIDNCWAQDVNINWMDTVGGLVGQNGGSIMNCFASGDISGEWEVAGLVGYNESGGIISGCHAKANVISTATESGGFVALNKGLIASSYCKATVTGVWEVGGFAGSNSYGDILKCFAVADVNGYRYVGGFVAKQSQGTIRNCYAQGTVLGDRWVGGLIGRNYSGTYPGMAEYCYTGSRVEWTGTEIGGLVGEDYQSNGDFQACFWDKDVNPDVNGIGNVDDPNVIGLPTSEMQKRSTFADAGWDTVNVWDIGENQTYPFLRIHLPSDIDKNDETNFYDFAILVEHWLEED
jgi:hypothetical protein